MNYLHLAGHLGADPEVRHTSSGKKVTSLRLATKIRRGSNEDTLWWKITVWGEQFDHMMPYLKKGSPLIAMGEIHKPEIYTDRNGQPQISMTMTASNLMFSPFGRSDKAQDSHSGASNSMPSKPQAEQQPAFAATENQQPIEDDEVPF